MSTQSSREELERQAEQLRSHLLTTVEELERKSHVRITDPANADDDERVEAAEAARSVDPGAPVDGTVREQKRLERRADRVREHLIDSVETLEKKARERILPIVVTGGALLLVLTVGFGFLFYKAMKS